MGWFSKIASSLDPGRTLAAALGDPLAGAAEDLAHKYDPATQATDAINGNLGITDQPGIAGGSGPGGSSVAGEVGHGGVRRHSRGNQVLIGAPAIVTPATQAADAAAYSEAWNEVDPATGAADAAAAPAAPAAGTSAPTNLLANDASMSDTSAGTSNTNDDEYRQAWFGNGPTTVDATNTNDSRRGTPELGRRLGLDL
jgi:hypothetical protein